MTRFNVTPAGKDDLAFITALEAECFSSPWRFCDFEKALDAPDRHLLVARDGQTPLGYIAAYTVAGETDVTSVAVLPFARRRGVGRALLRALLLQLAPAPTVFLEVRASNTAARALYTACGFAQIGVRRNYYKSPREDAVLYRFDGAAHDEG